MSKLSSTAIQRLAHQLCAEPAALRLRLDAALGRARPGRREIAGSNHQSPASVLLASAHSPIASCRRANRSFSSLVRQLRQPGLAGADDLRRPPPACARSSRRSSLPAYRRTGTYAPARCASGRCGRRGRSPGSRRPGSTSGRSGRRGCAAVRLRPVPPALSDSRKTRGPAGVVLEALHHAGRAASAARRRAGTAPRGRTSPGDASE